MSEFAAINRAALAKCPTLLEKLLPGGKVQGREYVCANISGGSGGSFSINMETGKWADFSTDESGIDLVALVAAIEGVNQFEAAKRLAEMVDYSMRDSELPALMKAQDTKPKPIMPVPDGVQIPVKIVHPGKGKPDNIFAYKDAQGRLLGLVARFNKETRDSKGKQQKEIIPFVYTAKGWKWQGFTRPFPFYGLENMPKLPFEQPIVVVEGEGKANELRKLIGDTMPVLSIYGGCGKVKDMDYAQLSGRRVNYWPDADSPGAKAAIEFAKKAMPIAASVKIIKPPNDVPETWDCGDAIKDGWDNQAILDYVGANRIDPGEFEKLARDKFGIGENNKTAGKPAFHAIDIFDFMTLDLPEREDLIAPILQRQGIAMLHAQRGIGKTFIALSIAHMVASGGKLFDRWEAPKPAKVLYIDGEMPARAMQDRLRAICAGMQSDITARGMFSLLTPDLQDAPMPNLATPEGQAAVEQEIMANDFIVIDNLATLTSYGRANEEESWRPIQEWLLRLRRQGKTTLVIHHEGKNGQQRGTSAKEDAVDTVISLKRPKDYREDEGSRFELHYLKCRHVTGKDAMPFEATLTSQDGHNLTWITRTLENVELEQYKELRESGYSIRDAAQEMGITKGKAEWLEKKRKQT